MQHSAVDENGLVVEMGGHMEYVTGRAYVMDLAPPGINAAEVVP